jgi:hypothetical protein
MIPETSVVSKGKLRLLVHAEGRLIASRKVSNHVLRSGAGLLARLLSGAPDVAPVNNVRVGFARETGAADITALTPPDPPVSPEALQSPVAAQDFTIIADQPRIIKVLVNALFKPTLELKDVSEAGLLAGDVLYNQVIFEPVTLRPGQDVTFFWEIDFPFDL